MASVPHRAREHREIPFPTRLSRSQSRIALGSTPVILLKASVNALGVRRLQEVSKPNMC